MNITYVLQQLSVNMVRGWNKIFISGFNIQYEN